MYSQFRLTALANARVDLELEQIALDLESRGDQTEFGGSMSDYRHNQIETKLELLTRQIGYIDGEIEMSKANVGPEMGAFAGNMMGGMIDQLPEEVRRELKGHDDDEEPPEGH